MPGQIKKFSKSLSIKSASVGVALSPADLEAINSFALSVLTADQIYSRKILLAHNAVDRDRERFPEDVLDDFAETLPGKSFLWAHDRRNYVPYGIWYKANTEEITKEAFAELAGEEAKLPESIETVKVLWASFYVLKEHNPDLVANMEAGVYRHFSIGFDAKSLVPVKGEYDQILFWEYVGPGEALEGSLVWLGAQNGATAQKAYKDAYLKNDDAKQSTTDKKEKTTMKDFLSRLGKALGKTLSDISDTAINEITQIVSEKDAEIKTLTTCNEELSPLAEMGKTFQDGLVSEFSRLKGVLGERDDSTEADTALKGYAKSMDIGFLQSEVKNLEKRVDEKFPSFGQLHGNDDDNRADGEKGKGSLIPEENDKK